MNMEKLISTQEAAHLLGISKVAVIKQIQTGKIKAVKVGNAYVISKEDINIVSNKEISDQQKQEIKKAVGKTISEYGETLRLLKDA